MSAFNLPFSLVGQVKLLARKVVEKDKTPTLPYTAKASFSTAQGNLKKSPLENVSLDQNLDKENDVDLASIFDYFENYLLQVEHFYSFLRILREQVQSDQIVKDGKIVSLRDWTCLSHTKFFTFLFGSLFKFNPCITKREYMNFKFRYRCYLIEVCMLNPKFVASGSF